MGMGIFFIIPMFCIFVFYVLSIKVIKILIEINVIRNFITKIKEQAKNPQNIRDLCLGLFINAIYGLSTDVSKINILIALICFYGIISSNDTIERRKKIN